MSTRALDSLADIEAALKLPIRDRNDAVDQMDALLAAADVESGGTDLDALFDETYGPDGHGSHALRVPVGQFYLRAADCEADRPNGFGPLDTGYWEGQLPTICTANEALARIGIFHEASDVDDFTRAFHRGRTDAANGVRRAYYPKH